MRDLLNVDPVSSRYQLSDSPPKAGSPQKWPESPLTASSPGTRSGFQAERPGPKTHLPHRSAVEPHALVRLGADGKVPRVGRDAALRGQYQLDVLPSQTKGAFQSDITTLVQLQPDAATVNVDETTCMILRVRALDQLGGLPSICGVYHRNDGRRANGLPVWKKADDTHPVWIYGTKKGRSNSWFIGGMMEHQRWERWTGTEFRYDNIVPAYNRQVPKYESTVPAEVPYLVSAGSWARAGLPMPLSVDEYSMEEVDMWPVQDFTVATIAGVQNNLDQLIGRAGTVGKIAQQISGDHQDCMESLRRDEKLLKALNGQSALQDSTPLDTQFVAATDSYELPGCWVGETVEMKDEAEDEWHRGVVTDLAPLKVRVLQTFDTGLDLPGLAWDCVRKMTPEKEEQIMRNVELKCEWCYSQLDCQPLYFSSGNMTATPTCTMCLGMSLDGVLEVTLDGSERIGLIDCLDRACKFTDAWRCPKSHRLVPIGSVINECNKDFRASQILERLNEPTGTVRLEIQFP